MKKSLLLFACIFSMFVIAKAQPSLVINEVDYDQDGVDSLEFIELKNVSLNSIDLSAFRILLYNCANSTLYDSIALPSYLLPPGSYYVICGAGGWVPNYNQLVADTFNIIENAATSSTTGSPDAIAIHLLGTPVFVDVVSYEGDCSTPTYVETLGVPYLSSDYNNDTLTGISRYPDGVDVNNNSTDFSRKCITPGASNSVLNSNCGGLPIGIADVTEHEVKIFPNPANDLVTVSTGNASGEVTIEVYDFTGKMVGKKSYANASEIVLFNTANLATGMYIFRIKTAENTFTRKHSVVHK